MHSLALKRTSLVLGQELDTPSSIQAALNLASSAWFGVSNGHALSLSLSTSPHSRKSSPRYLCWPGATYFKRRNHEVVQLGKKRTIWRVSPSWQLFSTDNDTWTGWGLDMWDNMNPDQESSGKYATSLFTEKAIEVLKKRNQNRVRLSPAGQCCSIRNASFTIISRVSAQVVTKRNCDRCPVTEVIHLYYDERLSTQV